MRPVPFAAYACRECSPCSFAATSTPEGWIERCDCGTSRVPPKWFRPHNEARAIGPSCDETACCPGWPPILHGPGLTIRIAGAGPFRKHRNSREWSSPCKNVEACVQSFRCGDEQSAWCVDGKTS